MAIDLSVLDELDLKENHDDIEDAAPKGLNFGFIGAGQAGCNLVSVLREGLDYRRTLYFNTTNKDIETVPEAYRVVPDGFDGAGKDREVGKSAAIAARGQLTTSMTRYFKKLDYIFVCASTAGGTGSGAVLSIVETAREYLENYSGYTKAEAAKRVGVIAMLPRKSEGGKAHLNTALFFDDLLNEDNTSKVSPLILIDNERIVSMVKDSIGSFTKTNTSVAVLFDIFNSISANHSRFVTFDPKDYSSVLQSGIITVSMNKLERYEREDDIARGIRLNISQTALFDRIDFTGSTHAALIVTADEKTLGEIPQEALTSANTTLLSIMQGENPTLHLGVYPASSKGIKVFTMIGGFRFPKVRREELEAYKPRVR